ncbi:MAG: hypothetical protein ACTSV6_05535 [Candidatus Heimdallarchaeota archaeon]
MAKKTKRKRRKTTAVRVTKKSRNKRGTPVRGYYYKAGKKHIWTAEADKKRKAKKVIKKKKNLWRGDFKNKRI